jgi:hypothetical protein
MNAAFFAPDMSTVRYRSESDVTTMSTLSDEEAELGAIGDENDSGLDVVGDYQEVRRLY